MNQNVMISLVLLDRITELLGHFYAAESDPASCDDIGDVIWTLMIKKQKLVLRDALAKVAITDNLYDRVNARAYYLRQKQILSDMGEPHY